MNEMSKKSELWGLMTILKIFKKVYILNKKAMSPHDQWENLSYWNNSSNFAS